jgi:hypothetical protein
MAVAADCNDGLVKEGHPERNLLKSTILPNRVAEGFSPPAPTTPPMNRDLPHAGRTADASLAGDSAVTPAPPVSLLIRCKIFMIDQNK